MKKKILVLFACLLCVTVVTAQSMTQSRQVIVKGKTDGVSEGRLNLLLTVSDNVTDTIATCDFVDNEFILQTEIDEPKPLQIVLDGYQGGFLLLAEPGATYDAFLTNDNRSYIKGGALNDVYTAHLAASDSMRNIIDGLRSRYDELRQNSKFRSASMVNDTLKREQQRWQKMTSNFLGAHDDLITAYTLYSNVIMRDMGLQECKKVYESMGNGAKTSHCGRMIKERIERMEKTENNAIAPDFTLNDADGNEITMSQVEAKVKIIDFWASWCGPCRMNNPALKKIYDEYHSKGLEIIGVSLDNKAENWKRAIEKDGLNWINVSSLKGWKCDVVQKYSVRGVPALFVLDENNRIIATGLRGEKLSAFLAGILK